MINNSLDYDFLREKCCIHHLYTPPKNRRLVVCLELGSLVQ
jgi:hypothetical protein